MNTKPIELPYQNKILRGYVDLPETFQSTEEKLPAVVQLHGMCGQCDSKIDLALVKGASHFFGGMKEQMVSCVDEFICSL